MEVATRRLFPLPIVLQPAFQQTNINTPKNLSTLNSMIISSAVVDTAYVLTAFAYFIIATRLLLRGLRRERFKSDDYVMLVATIFYGLNTAVYPIAACISPRIMFGAG